MQVVDSIGSRVVSHRGKLNTRFGVGSNDVDSGNHTSRIVHNLAAYTGTGLLGLQWRERHQSREQTYGKEQ